MGSPLFVTFNICFALLAGDPTSATGLLRLFELREFFALVGLARLIFWWPFFSLLWVVGGQKYDQCKRLADANASVPCLH